jgi:hypothetical protein
VDPYSRWTNERIVVLYVRSSGELSFAGVWRVMASIFRPSF